MKKLAFICSPFAGDMERNTERAKGYCRRAVELGYNVYCPHLLLPQFMREEDEREEAMLLGMEMLRRCDAVLAFGNRISPGMERELELAWELGKEIINMGGGL